MSQLDTGQARLEVVSDLECVRLLRHHALGRIALVDHDGNPLIFPVNYFFDEGVVVFRTDSGSKLALATGARVAFETDGWDPATGAGWSVLVRGIAHEIASPPNASTTRMRTWPVRPVAPGTREHWVGIWANEVSGRRFGPPVP